MLKDHSTTVNITDSVKVIFKYPLLKQNRSGQGWYGTALGVLVDAWIYYNFFIVSLKMQVNTELALGISAKYIFAEFLLIYMLIFLLLIIVSFSTYILKTVVALLIIFSSIAVYVFPPSVPW